MARNTLNDQQSATVSVQNQFLTQQARMQQNGAYLWAGDEADEKDPAKRDMNGAKAMQKLGMMPNDQFSQYILGMLGQNEAQIQVVDNTMQALADSGISTPLADQALENAQQALVQTQEGRQLIADAQKHHDEQIAGLSAGLQPMEKRAAIQEIEKEFRASLIGAIDNARESTQRLDLAEAQGDLVKATAEGNTQAMDSAQASVGMYTNLLKASDSLPIEKVVSSATNYVENIQNATQARDALRSQNLGDYIGTLEDNINRSYDRRIAADPFSPNNEVIERERHELLDVLHKKGPQLGGQFAYVEQHIQDSGLSTADKDKLEQDLLKSAASYQGEPDRFAATFLQSRNPNLAPLQLASVLDASPGMDAGEVMEVKLVNKGGQNMIIARETGAAGGQEVTISDPALVKQAMENGIDLKGMRSEIWLQVERETGIGSEQQQQLVLHGTKGHKITFNTTDHSPGMGGSERMAGLADTTRNIVSAGDQDRSFAMARDMQTHRLDLAGREDLARETIALAKREAKVRGIEQQAEAAYASLSPQAQQMVASMRANMQQGYAHADMGKTAPTDVAAAINPGAGKGPEHQGRG